MIDELCECGHAEYEHYKPTDIDVGGDNAPWDALDVGNCRHCFCTSYRPVVNESFTTEAVEPTGNSGELEPAVACECEAVRWNEYNGVVQCHRYSARSIRSS